GFIGTSFPLNPVPPGEPARRNIRNQRARATMPPYAPSLDRMSREHWSSRNGGVRNPRETWPNLGAEAGLSTHTSVIVVKESLPKKSCAQTQRPPCSGGPAGCVTEIRCASDLYRAGCGAPP